MSIWPGSPNVEGRAGEARRLSSMGTGSLSLQRLAQLAARLLDAESAQVSIISDVQVVRAGVGAAEPSVGQTSAAEDSLCTVTVNGTGALVVDEAVRDPRVSALPPVTSGAVGAYLGVPLVSGTGEVIGAICVFEGSPRSWTSQDVSLLGALVEPVMAELELEALASEYAGDRIVWLLAAEAAGLGAFDWDLASGVVRSDDRMLALFGATDAASLETVGDFTARVHPDDRDGVSAALSDAIRTCGVFESEFRVLLPGNEIRWIAARGRALADTGDRTVQVLGAAYDSTAVQEGEARISRVLEAMPTAFFQLDNEWRFSYVNAMAARMLGARREALLGAVVWDRFPQVRGTEYELKYRHAVGTGQPVSFDAYSQERDAWFEVRAWPSPDGLSVYLLDVSERHAAQEAVDRVARRTSLLSAVSEALMSTLDTGESVARLAPLVVPALGEWCVVSLVDVDGGGLTDWRRRVQDVGCWHADPELRPVVERYAQVRVASLLDQSFLARSVATGEVVEIADSACEAIAAILAPGEARELCERLAPVAALVLPLQGRGRTVGVLSVFRGSGWAPFTAEDRETLVEVAIRAGLALDNARLYAEQRDLAEGLQRSLMTAPPEVDGVEIEVRYEPAAQAAQVGGDWYDAFLQQDGSTVVVIGDVVGHDTEAAAAMGQMRSLLRGIAVHTGSGPASVLCGVDQVMETLQVDTTATALVARLEPDVLRWSNAGHPPPMLVDADGSVRQLTSSPDVLLGLQPSVSRQEHVAAWEPGATVLLYTDGLVERRGQSLDQGMLRLREELAVLAALDLPLGELCDRLLQRMLPETPEDDVALAAVRLQGL